MDALLPDLGPLNSTSSPLSCCDSITPETSISSPLATTVNDNKTASKIMIPKPTLEQLKSVTAAELKDILINIYDENLKLEAATTEARVTVAHQKLQLNLLTIESQEALNRLRVENFMLRRDAEILRTNPHNSVQTRYIENLREYSRSTKNDNIITRRRLEKAERLIEVQAAKLSSAREEIAQLQERIRQNRQHINEMRHPGGSSTTLVSNNRRMLHNRSRHTLSYTQAPKTNRSSQFHDSSRENQENLNALLLAGSILSQKGNSALTTPMVGFYHPPSSPLNHNDIKQPPDSSGSPGNPQASSSASFFSSRFKSNVSLHDISGSQFHKSPLERHRRSRDSTISASDAEEITYQCANN